MDPGWLVLLVGLAVAGLVAVGVRSRRRDEFGTPADEATFHTLHTAALAAPALREGLGPGIGRALRPLRALLGSPAVALTDLDRVLAAEGQHDVAEHAMPAAQETLDSGRTTVASTPGPLRHAVAAPLRVDEDLVGTLVAFSHDRPTAGLVRATQQVARFVSSQLDLAELDKSRRQAAEAEIRALRAQISPHFVFNALTAIASFVRTDPERARELLLEFADFTRYSFRGHGEFTTLADELRSVERYLALEQARFGDRLRVTVRVAPEVLPVAVPFLCLQPLVENAVRHGLEGRPGTGTVSIVAEDAGTDCVVSVEDDGIGMDPERIRRALDGEPTGPPDDQPPVAAQADGDQRATSPRREPHASVGLANVDARLRSVFGDEHGLVVETAPGAGTKVSLRVPKFRAGVHAT